MSACRGAARQHLASQYLASLNKGEGAEKVEAQALKVVRGHFRPEFLNRLDDTSLIRRLSASDLALIVGIQVRRLSYPHQILLELSDAAQAWLGRVSYGPAFSARPDSRRCSAIYRTR